MTDILERLHSQKTSLGTLWPEPNLHEEAAAEITRLREETTRLREALKPFVPGTQWIDPAIPDTRPIDVMVRAGELRAARAAIREDQ